jgi:TetR/AcrR family transcriptional regulator, fatty acid metabolism regulator protein
LPGRLRIKEDSMAQRPPGRQVNTLAPERRITRIMPAARGVFREQGNWDVLISGIADRVFTNKHDRLQRMAEAWRVELMACGAAAFGAVRGEGNPLRFIISHHHRSIRRDPALSRLVARER